MCRFNGRFMLLKEVPVVPEEALLRESTLSSAVPSDIAQQVAVRDLAITIHADWKGKVETAGKVAWKNKLELAAVTESGSIEIARLIVSDAHRAKVFTRRAVSCALLSDGSMVPGL